MIKIGRRGSLNIKIQVKGQAGHVAYPHFAVNPIPPLLDYLQGVSSDPLDQGTEHFDPSNVEITSIDVGNPVTNVIPDRAKAAFNVRFNSLHSGESLIHFFQKKMEEVKKKHPPSLVWELEGVISGKLCKCSPCIFNSCFTFL